MDNITSKDRSFESDLESGRTSSEEDSSKGLVSGNIQVKNLLSRVTCGFGFNGSIGGECVVNSCGNSGKTSEVAAEDLELLIDECSGREEGGEHAATVDKKHMKEKHKKANSKKAAKPPRPPKGPALDASDLKLVKEISELAMKKRAKIERMKVLKKMKAAKSSSSSNSSLIALVITVLFCLIILFQGICSRNSSSMNFHGSPEPSVATDSLISVQFYSNPSTSDSSGPSSASPNSVENASHSDLRSSG
ncbi:uncharacterized protein LOC132268749 [Cornus florida]|uniref:uncharacterized protein LOC132268749 n=1 Tax=Cornus florida TaxID=4283 RepID=UPI00289EDA49|nr:uncharacterized protein LOC132268749 [Cornus florida]